MGTGIVTFYYVMFGLVVGFGSLALATVLIFLVGLGMALRTREIMYGPHGAFTLGQVQAALRTWVYPPGKDPLKEYAKKNGCFPPDMLK